MKSKIRKKKVVVSGILLSVLTTSLVFATSKDFDIKQNTSSDYLINSKSESSLEVNEITINDNNVHNETLEINNIYYWYSDTSLFDKYLNQGDLNLQFEYQVNPISGILISFISATISTSTNTIDLSDEYDDMYFSIIPEQYSKSNKDIEKYLNYSDSENYSFDFGKSYSNIQNNVLTVAYTYKSSMLDIIDPIIIQFNIPDNVYKFNFKTLNRVDLYYENDKRNSKTNIKLKLKNNRSISEVLINDEVWSPSTEYNYNTTFNSKIFNKNVIININDIDLSFNYFLGKYNLLANTYILNEIDWNINTEQFFKDYINPDRYKITILVPIELDLTNTTRKLVEEQRELYVETILSYMDNIGYNADLDIDTNEEVSITNSLISLLIGNDFKFINNEYYMAIDLNVNSERYDFEAEINQLSNDLKTYIIKPIFQNDNALKGLIENLNLSLNISRYYNSVSSSYPSTQHFSSTIPLMNNGINQEKFWSTYEIISFTLTMISIILLIAVIIFTIIKIIKEKEAIVIKGEDANEK